MYELLATGGLLKVIKYVAIITGIVIVFRYFAHRNKENKYMKDDKTAANSLETGQAISLRIAMNPSGSAALFDVDGTNTTAIMNIAKEIKNLQGVIDAYNSRFSGSLLHHLEIELGAEKFQTFLALAGGASNSSTDYKSVKDGVPAYRLVRTTKQANARSTAKKTGLWDHSNILKTFDPYNVVGSSTGKTGYDVENDIIFVEVKSRNKKKQDVTFWVAKSQVEFIAPADFDRRKASGEKFTLQQLEGLGCLPMPELATKNVAIIYGEDFAPVDKVRERALLGVPDMFLRAGEKMLVRFLTIDGCRRWVDVKDVFLYSPKTSAR